MPFVERDGLRLHYQLHGRSGDPLVLIHGYMGAAADWLPVIEALSGRHRILVLDNRGHGESDAPPDPAAYTVEAMLADTQRVLAQVGFERFHLVGHSVGGAVAQEIALGEPERVLTLTLQDTTDSFAGHDAPGGTPPYMPPAMFEIAAERRRKMSAVALEGGFAGLVAWRGSTDRLKALRMPTLIVYGDRDASRSVEGSHRLRELIPHARLEVIEGAGHSPHRELPDAYNAVLERFLREHRASE